MELLAGGCFFVEVEDVEFFEQQQRLSADKFGHVEGGAFLFFHRDALFGGFLAFLDFWNCDLHHISRNLSVQASISAFIAIPVCP